MAHRYRLYPTDGQAAAMRVHCGQARFMWNLALEQAGMWRPGMKSPRFVEQCRQLTELRGCTDWLADGSSVVQRQALRDLDRAMQNWWAGTHRRPRKRTARSQNGFAIRNLTVVTICRRWATVVVPKVGPVRFRLSRPLPVGTKSARVTLDRAGRWHVSFTATPLGVVGPGDGTIIGVDRGVVVPFQCSDGRSFDVPGLSSAEAARLVRLHRRLSRQTKGSNRWACTKHQIACIKAREADRRKDAIEKATTTLARSVDIVRIEDLKIRQMTKSASGTVEVPGVNVAAKRGLNRSIMLKGWGLFEQRLVHKIGDRLEKVPAAFTSQRCSECGHASRENRLCQATFRCVVCGFSDNADVNAAKNIAAGHAVTGRGGNGAGGPPGEASTILIGAA